MERIIDHPVRIITKHRGRVEEMEYGYVVRYVPRKNGVYEKLWNIDPACSHFCVAHGEFRWCDDCGWLGEDGCEDVSIISSQAVGRIVRRYEDMGCRMTEDHGELIIDGTGHEVVLCDAHTEQGCKVCWKGCGEEHEDE